MMNAKSWMMVAAAVALVGCQATAPKTSEPAPSEPAVSVQTQPAPSASASAPAATTPAPAASAGLAPRPVDASSRRCDPLKFQPLPSDAKGTHQVELLMHVELDGRVSQVRLNKGSGLTGLDEAVLRMGQSCRFNAVQGAFAPAPVLQPLHYTIK